MSHAPLRAAAPRAASAPEPTRDPELLEAYLEDASGSARGTAAGLLRVRSEEEAALFLARTQGQGIAVLPQAARSSLTGGATPRGEVILSVERMTQIGPIATWPGGASVTVQPGVRLRELNRALALRGFYYPPVPTYQDAMLGGTVSTNAGGPATFKYGVTREWVEALRLVLWNGDVLALERGQALRARGEAFEVTLSDASVIRIPTPPYALPALKKLSAGYFSSDPLDLVDLFVGSEGTLGLISEVRVRLAPLPAAVLTAFAFLDSFERAFALAGEIREEAMRARSDRSCADVRAIELVDGAALDLLRRHGEARRLRVGVPERARAALLFDLELAQSIEQDAALEALEAAAQDRAHGPLARFFRILARHAALEELELALPGDASRQEALRELREAVPRRVNEILAEARRRDASIHKVGGDLIVPFERAGEMMRIYESGFARRGLAYAIWGHLSDGNLHPNALPRSAAESRSGTELMLEFGQEAARLGGCPLSEHGVGRSPLKQELLLRFLGEPAVAAMRRIKRALDPENRFAPGVIFSV